MINKELISVFLLIGFGILLVIILVTQKGRVERFARRRLVLFGRMRKKKKMLSNEIKKGKDD